MTGNEMGYQAAKDATTGILDGRTTVQLQNITVAFTNNKQKMAKEWQQEMYNKLQKNKRQRRKVDNKWSQKTTSSDKQTKNRPHETDTKVCLLT